MIRPISVTLSLTLAATLGLTACSNTQSISHQNSDASHSVINNDQHAKTDTHHSSDHKASWSYTGQSGPDFWGDVAGNEQCKIGKEQSPINITKVLLDDASAPQSMFRNSAINVVNNGHTVVFTPEDTNNTTLIDGDVYTLKQFHYHTPSEHQISGTNYPAELHFVHANKDGNLAVIGVMLNPTANTSKLGQLIHSSQLATQNNSETHLDSVDINKLLPVNSGFYHYEGSLTTPPCSEKVQWYIANEPLAVSNDDLVQLTKLYDGNNRPVQQQGTRKVVLIK